MDKLIRNYVTDDRKKARTGKDSYMVLPNGTLRQLGLPNDPRNCLTALVGAPAAGKTNSTFRTTLAVSNASVVVLDQKGRLCQEFKSDYESRGFQVHLLNFQDPAHSARFNPLKNVKTTTDVRKFTDMMVKLTSDPYSHSLYDEAPKILLNAALGALAENISGFQKIMADFIRLLKMIDARDFEDFEKSRIYKLFREHNEEYRKRTGERSWAFDQLRKFSGLPASQISSILVQAQTTIDSMDSREMRRMTAFDDIDFDRIGEEKTAIFVQTSDTDRSKDLPINLFFSSLMSSLSDHADSMPDGRLPRPVLFMLDDFCTSAKIYNFANMMSNMRSRNISAMFAIQAISQLEAYYGQEWTTIINDCDTVAYLGGNDPRTADYFSKVFNVPLEDIMNMGLKENYMKMRGEKAQLSKTQFFTDSTGTTGAASVPSAS